MTPSTVMNIQRSVREERSRFSPPLLNKDKRKLFPTMNENLVLTALACVHLKILIFRMKNGL